MAVQAVAEGAPLWDRRYQKVQENLEVSAAIAYSSFWIFAKLCGWAQQRYSLYLSVVRDALTQPQGQRGNEAKITLKLLYVARHIGRQRFYRADIIA